MKVCKLIAIEISTFFKLSSTRYSTSQNKDRAALHPVFFYFRASRTDVYADLCYCWQNTKFSL